MVTAAWIAAAVVILVWTALLKPTVSLVGRGADNGWDNALAYTVACGLILIPIQWLVGSGSFLLWLLIPVVALVAQIWSLKVIYELKALHAALLGVVHLVFSSLVIGGMALATGFVAAFLMYKKIVTDPVWLLRFICGLIGVEWPF